MVWHNFHSDRLVSQANLVVYGENGTLCVVGYGMPTTIGSIPSPRSLSSGINT